MLSGLSGLETNRINFPPDSTRSGVTNLDRLRRARRVRDRMDFWRVNIDVLLRYLRLHGLQGTWVGLRFGGSVPPKVGAQTRSLRERARGGVC